MFGILPKCRLANTLGEGNKAKLGAGAFTGEWHFGCGLGLKRCFLEFAYVRKPFSQRILDLLHEDPP